MSIKPNVIPKDIADYLRHDAHGHLTWVGRSANKTKVGGRAGWLGKDGYVYVMLRGKQYGAHRLVFFLENGWCPDFLDHRNGIRNDNAPSNLRPSDRSRNAINSKTRSDSKSGRAGVVYSTRQNRWVASITESGSRKHLGTFKTLLDAVAARTSAENLYHGDNSALRSRNIGN